MKNRNEVKNKSNLTVRILFYIAGLIIMTVGVAISVRADLGVSTISSIPYTMTCVAGIDLGIATIIFSIFMVLLQIVLLRKEYKIINLLQLPVGILFGLFLTFCCNLTVYIPEPSNFLIKLIMTLISTVLVALGVFLYVPAGFILLAPEGAMLAISKITKIRFANVKLISDITMVVISLVTCLIVIRELGSVGIGTILAALLVGNEVKVLTRFFGDARDKALKINAYSDSAEQTDDTPLLHIMERDVYTVKENTSLLEVLRLFREKKVSGVPVLNDKNELTGFISDGDIIRHLASEQSVFVNPDSIEKIGFNIALLDLIKQNVASIAKKKVITVSAEDDLDKICYTLWKNHLKKAPVMQDGEMIGIINVSNIIKYAVSLLEKEL